MNILVGVPLGSSVRAEFFRSFWPAIQLMDGEGHVTLEYTKYMNTPNARNELVKRCLDGSYSHLFFMDSDMSFPPYTLSRLLNHDKDIVGGLYTVKTPPFNTVAFLDEDTGAKEWTSWNPENMQLKKVAGLATGCMLVKRQVLEALEWPYFEYRPDPEGRHKFMSEDVVFCIDARKKGFEIWCDPTVLCGHMGNIQITPFLNEQSELKVKTEVI